MENFKELFSIIPFITLFGFSITFMKVIVNFINANEIDNLLKTPWKKFIDSLAISSLLSLITISMIISEFYTEEFKDEIINHPTDFLILIFVLYLLISFVLFMLGYFFISITKLLWNTNAYYIVDKNGEEWKVEKALDHNRIYVVRDHLTKIVDIDSSYSIKKAIIPNSKVQNLFNLLDKIQHFKIISFAIFLSLVMGFSILFFLNINNKVSFGTILLLTIVLLVIIVQGYNDYLYNKKNETESEVPNNELENLDSNPANT
ncbi:hypothetical protein MKZ20_21525 [Psychrobacillus sp. FSL K6-2684]|uniref:hypothetical protein n=1 Tax=unclassified Psychrobacillus TaxID=2636677 RepID=UPI0030F89F58